MDSVQAAVQTDTNLSDGMCERYTAGFIMFVTHLNSNRIPHIYLPAFKCWDDKDRYVGALHCSNSSSRGSIYF